MFKSLGHLGMQVLFRGIYEVKYRLQFQLKLPLAAIEFLSMQMTLKFAGFGERLSTEGRNEMPVRGCRHVHCFRGHVFRFSKGEGEKLHRLFELSFQIIPRTNNLRPQFFRINKTAIEVRTSVTTKFSSTGVPILNLIPRQRKKASRAGHQVMAKFPVSFYWGSGNKQSR